MDLAYSLLELENFSAKFEESLNSLSTNNFSKPHGLSFLRHTFTQTPIQTQTFQVIMVGGSHIESAIIKLHKSATKITKFKELSLPKFTCKEDLFNHIHSLIEPKINFVSLNLAYKLEPVERSRRLDGILLEGSKEQQFQGLEGELIGASLEAYLKEKYGQKINFLVCNNLSSLGLLARYNKQFVTENTDNLVAGVVSTGVNFGFFADKEFVNLETANYSGFQPSPTGLEIDTKSNNAGHRLLEKEVGGLYLPKHFNLLAQEQGLAVTVKDIRELSQLAASKQATGSELAQELLARSASLVAMQVAAIYRFKAKQSSKQTHNQARTDKLHLKVILEGWLFWEGAGYREKVLEYLQKLGVSAKSIEFVKVKFGFILGSAKVVYCIKIITRKHFTIPELALVFRNFLYAGQSPPMR